jgi:hypothetical protein
VSELAHGPDNEVPPVRRSRTKDGFRALAGLVVAVRDAEPAEVAAASRQLGQARRVFIPLGYAAGTIVLLLRGVKLLFANWRLSLIELVPALWIWITTWNLKAHFLHGRSLRQIHGPIVLLVAVVVVAVSVASYWCNAVFAFAIDGPEPPRLRPAFTAANTHARYLFGWGLTIGVLHAIATVWFARLGLGWYGLALGAVLGLMIVTFVSVPARLITQQARDRESLRNRVSGAAIGGALSAVAIGPGFMLNRLGLLLIGLQPLRIVGVLVFSVGIGLQAAGMTTVKAVKLSTKLVNPSRIPDGAAGLPNDVIAPRGRA